MLIAIVATLALIAFIYFQSPHDLTVSENIITPENVTYSDLYTKQIEIGNTKLNLEVKTATFTDEDGHDWLSGEYRFYSIEKKPKLLATVPSLIPPRYDLEDGEDPLLTTKDVTGDSVPEIFVLVLQSGSNLREWEILQLKNGSLENITIKGQKDNPKWVEADDIYYVDGYVVLHWHGTDMRGAIRYILDGNELVLDKSVRQTFGNGAPDSCDVSMKNANESEYTIIDASCEDPRYPTSLHRYFNFSPERIARLAELYTLRSNPTFSNIATAYREYCPTELEGATFLGAKSFVDLVQRVERKYPVDSGEILYIPCIQGAYQSSYLFTLFDGNTYTHLEVPTILADGERKLKPRIGEPSYNPATSIFTDYVASNGMHSCWAAAEYKVVGREVVLQKFTADRCEYEEGEVDEGEKVIYDINES